jgi:hypothetical protein
MSLYTKIKRSLFPAEGGSPDFIPQFRLENRSRDPDNKTGLEMRIADPLWMLGRQWQFGEFRGEDNGSPISVSANFRKEKTTHYSFPGNGALHELGSVPLEARVEALAVEPKDLRSKVRIGQKMEDLIRAAFSSSEAGNFITKLRGKYPLTEEGTLDRKSRLFFNLTAGNAIDGGKLWEEIRSNQFPKGEFLPLAGVAEKLGNWYRQLFLPAGDQTAWDSRNLLHRFSVHGQNDVHLHAPDYQSGHLDWFSFDTADISIDPAKQAEESEVFMPVRVSFAAMPDKRLFAFEDSKLDLAGMEVEPDDLVRLMIIDFSLVSGSDWFTIPISMNLGELCWINRVTVRDVFGVKTVIGSQEGQFLGADPLSVWDAFKIRDRHVPDFVAADHFLYLPPATAFRQESRPIEELLFLRDEYANMVWAIEKTVRNAMGKPTDGFDLHLELNGPFLGKEEGDENGDGLPRFRLATPVPSNWIPYLPFHIDGSDTDIELRRAVMMRNESSIEPEDINPISTLAAKDVLNIREEAVPRAGVRVQLTRQRVRWTDGNTYIWMGRKVLAGRGEGSSGLAFDQLKD